MDYLAHVRADGDALLAAARQAPDAPVPSCPDWTVTDLLAHTGGIHRWVTEIVRTRATDRLAFPTAPDEVLGWFEEGMNELVDALSSVEPDTQVWNWRDRAPADASFWFRRMAHETGVHRWDGQRAVGAPSPIDAALAADGVDEYLGFVEGWLARSPKPELTGTIVLAPTDRSERWNALSRGNATATVSGPMSDVFLWLVNRDSGGVAIEGDAEVAGRWSTITF